MTLNWNDIKGCFFYTETYIVQSSRTGNLWYAEMKNDGAKNVRLGQSSSKDGAKRIWEAHAAKQS